MWAYPKCESTFPSKSQSECPSVCPVLFRFQQGIPEFLELQIPENPMVVMVTSCARSLRDPTQQDFINVHTLPIYKCHTCFKF